MLTEEKIRQIGEHLLPHVVSLTLLPTATSGPADALNVASASLIDTGSKRILITCEHVWSSFSSHCNYNERAVIAVMTGNQGLCCDIKNLPVLTLDKSLDLAILDVTESQIFSQGSKRFASVPEWPPKRPSLGDTIVMIGFPSSEKELIDRAHIMFNGAVIIDTVSSVTDRRIVAVDEEAARQYTNHVFPDAEHEIAFGGMSGCPAFVNREMRFDFAGIVYEGPKSDFRGMFFIVHADFIASDGSINWSHVPPL